MRKPSKQKKITQSDLAKQLGISRQLVAHHQKTGKAPALDDLSGWVAYLAACGREGSVPKQYREKIAEQKLRILTATAAKLELEKDEKEKTLINRDNAFRFIDRMVGQIFFGELERLKMELPNTLVGKNEVEIHVEVGEQIKVVKKILRNEFEKYRRENSTSGEKTK
jgi:transcriptional regulator with XRE-family HTH domain